MKIHIMHSAADGDIECFANTTASAFYQLPSWSPPEALRMEYVAKRRNWIWWLGALALLTVCIATMWLLLGGGR
jgi:hypothetical protein